MATKATKKQTKGNKRKPVKQKKKRGKQRARKRAKKRPAKATKPARPTRPSMALEAPIGSKAFAALQRKWYDKLAGAGFDDIEWVDHRTGIGQNSDYLKRPDQERIKHVKPNTYEYYRLCTNYLTHAPNKAFKKPYHRTAWAMYCDGATYRQIIKAANRKHRARHTLFYIHGIIKQLEAQCMQWNLTAAEGLLNPANADFVVLDVPLRTMDVQLAVPGKGSH